jgi:hypothetical protein
VTLGGKDYLARMVVREDVNGNIYYDNDLSSVEEISGRSGDAILTKTGAADVSTDEHSIANWYAKINPDNVSKVIDPETGEPQVVYHGTKKSGFTVFNTEGEGKTEGTGAWFSNAELGAATYSGTRNSAEYDEGADAGNYAVFLNIKDPDIYDFEGNAWNDGYPERVILDENGDVEAYFYSKEEEADYLKEHPDARIETQNSNLSTDELAREARARDADGVIFNNVMDEGGYGQGYGYGETSYVAFSPNQIKSATDNNGNFSPDKDSILFQEEYSGIEQDLARNKAAIKPRPFARRMDSFRKTERAYGGKITWNRMKKAGLTKLDYRQWVLVRTPEFKRLRGDWEAARHAEILDGRPVAAVRVEDNPQGSFGAVEAWAAALFKKQGGKATNPELGDVILNKQSARNSMAHGVASEAKKAAFAAVKDVIEKGAIIHRTTGGREDSFYISAPVDISGKENIVTVLVHRDPNTQRMYLHSVILKENLLGQSVSAADAKASEPHSATTTRGMRNILKNLLDFNPDTVSSVTNPETGEPVPDKNGGIWRQKTGPQQPDRDTGERATDRNTGSPAPGKPHVNTQPWDVPGTSTLDKFQIQIQDKMLPVKKLYETLLASGASQPYNRQSCLYVGIQAGISNQSWFYRSAFLPGFP